jgi:hypothetical protein
MKTKIKNWVEQFHGDGFLVIPNVLKREKCYKLIDELTWRSRKDKSKIQKRMFEDSPENLSLFKQEPVLTFAKELIGNTQDFYHMELGDNEKHTKNKKIW